MQPLTHASLIPFLADDREGTNRPGKMKKKFWTILFRKNVDTLLHTREVHHEHFDK